MARIRYDRYLQDVDELISISNADNDRSVDVTPETFENPPIKFTILEAEGTEDPFTKFSVEGNDEIKRELSGKVTNLLCGQLPGWRLIGADFSPTCFSMCCAAVRPEGKESCGNIRYDCISLHFVSFTRVKMEIEADYADGLPPRRYVAEMDVTEKKPGDDILHVIVTEYLGKRKVRRIEFTEGEETEEGQLCHIIEY